ncbi:hypothetical protein ACFVSW_22935 [Neobacillus sp. NPDC058068]|uniref:hypothetical protein n=1 Tax=Neobacillus sp. NPDC058068 TaxID=3346325 RepID=UPI0036DD96D4
MKTRVGVIGPRDAVNLILTAAADFHQLEMTPFPYKTIEQTAIIIKENRHFVDQWFFSGQAPYHFALESGLTSSRNSSFVTLHGSRLLGAFLEAQVHEGRILKHLSLDTIQEEEVSAVQKSFNIESLNVNTFSYTGYIPVEEILEFHISLYESGKTEASITCVQSVYDQLRERGIPCYRVMATIPDIQGELRYIHERGQSAWYRKSQLAILGIEVFYSSNIIETQNFSYESQHRELELKRILLKYVELVSGSLMEIGNGVFFIYTTRGEIELHLNYELLFELIEKVKVESKLNIRMGIGYGFTAFDAEHHVRLAFRHASNYEESVIVSVNEEKEVTECILPGHVISFQQRKWGDDWKLKFKEANLSVTIVSKIDSLSKYYGKTIVTAQELSQWLKRTERNARRILTELEYLGLVKVTGEEQLEGRGRPRKLYKLLF